MGSDTLELRKARGAFFTPPPIADYLASIALEGDGSARVLDPTCGESVFLAAAGRELLRGGASPMSLPDQLFGVDLHEGSLEASRQLLAEEGLSATLQAADFFSLSTPAELQPSLPLMDVVIGNPPFVRYQQHQGLSRKRSLQAALAQGVRLSNLASSWAALLVHACGFLKPDGRLAMVLPAELLTVHYAEPIRRWLRERFAAVHLVLFDQLQFATATEDVVLLIAGGSGGCDSFSLVPASDAEELPRLRLFGRKHLTVTPADKGKWTDILLPLRQRQLFRHITEEHFTPLSTYGIAELGTVTGANSYFALTEETRLNYQLEEQWLLPICPPGTKHLKGLSFSKADWERQRKLGSAVWLLHPTSVLNRFDEDGLPDALFDYLDEGYRLQVPEAYKCRVRSPWWLPPAQPAPDLFFTYMSHRFPRLISNGARASYLNSMHGIRLKHKMPATARHALPLLALNSVTLLGAEVQGRAYGGGILKMEPREASTLWVPPPGVMLEAWKRLKGEKASLENKVRNGLWINVVKRVDEVLLRDCLRVPADQVAQLFEGGQLLRGRRLRRS